MGETKEVKIMVAEPSPLGLFGLAMVTLVASSQKLGLTTGLSLVIPWAIFLGGLVQIIASLFDFKHNNIFGATAFGAFGFFWLAIAMTWMTSMGVFGEVLQEASDNNQLAIAFIGYLIFSLYMTIGAMETTKLLFWIFVAIDFLFIGLVFSTFHIAYNFTKILGGVAELVIAILSFYGSAAGVLNKHFGKVVLPVGKPFGIFKK